MLRNDPQPFLNAFGLCAVDNLGWDRERNGAIADIHEIMFRFPPCLRRSADGSDAGVEGGMNGLRNMKIFRIPYFRHELFSDHEIAAIHVA